MTTDISMESSTRRKGQFDCPSKEELSAFASGECDEATARRIHVHVANCQRCEDSLGHLTADHSELIMQLRRAARHKSPPLEPECIRMQQRVVQADFREQTNTGASTAAGAGSYQTPQSFPTKHFGHYELISEIGEGAFGRVFLATDLDLHRPVALKVAKYRRPTTGEHSLWHEARAAARLRHPGIVAIYEVADDPAPYIAMEYVDGTTLKQLLSQRMSICTAVNYLIRTAEAIQFAHSQCALHRDLKPGNILVGKDGQLKITDFGLALHEDEQHARSGEFAGTPAYMSPEQVRGEVHRIDGRSDLWSLGVIFYEMLTGRVPFRGSRHQVFDEILFRSPRPPRQVCTEVPRELERICLRCLEKRIEDRYLSVTDLIQDLSQWQLTNQTHGRGVGRWAGFRMIAGVLLGVLVIIAFQYLRMDHAAGTQVAKPDLQTAVIPGPLENTFKPFAWADLMDRQPTALAQSSQLAQYWNYVADREEIRADSPAMTLLPMGETQSTAFRLQVDLSKYNDTGYAGLFWGYRRKAVTEHYELWECQALMVRRNGTKKVLVVREVLEVDRFPSGGMAFHRNTVGRTEIPETAIVDGRLDLTVLGGRVDSVRWLGQPLNDLTDPPGDPDHEVRNCAGQVGLVNAFGASCFQNFRWMQLRSN